jgi:chromosome segregation ATPase
VVGLEVPEVNNDPYRELVAKADRHHQRLGSLEEKLRDRTGNLNGIRDRLRKLETNIGEHSIGAIVSKIDDVAKKFVKTSSRLDDQSATIAELRRNIETLHRKIRVSSGLPHADFDTWQQEISPEMITSIREGLASTPVPETKLRQLRKSRKGRRRSSCSGTSRCRPRSRPSGC